jgi:hypothetical protein
LEARLIAFEVDQDDFLGIDLNDILLIPHQSIEKMTLNVRSILQDMIASMIIKLPQLVRIKFVGVVLMGRLSRERRHVEDVFVLNDFQITDTTI